MLLDDLGGTHFYKSLEEVVGDHNVINVPKRTECDLLEDVQGIDDVDDGQKRDELLKDRDPSVLHQSMNQNQ